MFCTIQYYAYYFQVVYKNIEEQYSNNVCGIIIITGLESMSEFFEHLLFTLRIGPEEGRNEMKSEMSMEVCINSSFCLVLLKVHKRLKKRTLALLKAQICWLFYFERDY